MAGKRSYGEDRTTGIKTSVSKRLGIIDALEKLGVNVNRDATTESLEAVLKAKKKLKATGMQDGGGVMPDIIDLDGDGNKDESIKSAASQKKKNKGMMGGGYVKPKKMGHGGMAYRGRNYAYGGRVAKYKG
tara:strand:- start:1883 stop:2275 length:393 start_codon:yes stop_codon:yes gene_type:complete